MEELDADDFLLLYLKRRIEHDGRYQWYDAPRLPATLSPKCEKVEQAAHAFEMQKVRKLNQLLEPLIRERKLNFQTFSYILDAYLDLVVDRNARSNADVKDGLCFPLIAIISFSGFYARRLSELDAEQHNASQQWERDFRKEINQLSIYASKTLRKRIAEIEGYSWEKFCDDTVEWVSDVDLASFGEGRIRRLHSSRTAAVGLGAAAVGLGVLAFLLLYRRSQTLAVNP